jgi:hypothetical protein
MLLKSIPKSKNHQRRIFLDNYYRQRSKSKLNSKTKLKKKGRAESEARYRPRRYSSTPPTIGGTVPSGLASFPKKKLHSK